MVERMATHTTALADVSRDLAAKQQTIDLALQHRHASLQTLFADIAEKSQEFDAVTRHFAASFEDSFNKAQARAQEISAALTVSTKNAASTVQPVRVDPRQRRQGARKDRRRRCRPPTSRPTPSSTRS